MLQAKSSSVREKSSRQHFGHVLQNFVVPIAQYTVTITHKDSRPRGIVSSLIEVLTTIEFDDDLGLRTDEIDNVAGNGNPALKPKPFELSSAQVPPEQPLGIGACVAELPGALS